MTRRGVSVRGAGRRIRSVVGGARSRRSSSHAEFHADRLDEESPAVAPRLLLAAFAAAAAFAAFAAAAFAAAAFASSAFGAAAAGRVGEREPRRAAP